MRIFLVPFFDSTAPERNKPCNTSPNANSNSDHDKSSHDKGCDGVASTIDLLDVLEYTLSDEHVGGRVCEPTMPYIEDARDMGKKVKARAVTMLIRL
jgi:hypothetical protein